MAKNRFSCKIQMAFTTSKLASSKAPKVRAIAQDTFKLLKFFGFTRYDSSEVSFRSVPTVKEFSKIKMSFKFTNFFLNIQAGRKQEDSGEIWSGGVLDIKFKLKRLYGSSSCSQLHVKRS